jgi:N-acetylmuramoyl-L-alanine amidase
MNDLVILLDNGHGKNTPGKRSPKWSDLPQIFE